MELMPFNAKLKRKTPEVLVAFTSLRAWRMDAIVADAVVDSDWRAAFTAAVEGALLAIAVITLFARRTAEAFKVVAEMIGLRA